MRCCFHSFKDLYRLSAYRFFERIAKVRAFMNSPKTFCRFLTLSYSQNSRQLIVRFP
jgi:hypothetical protein